MFVGFDIDFNLNHAVPNQGWIEIYIPYEIRIMDFKYYQCIFEGAKLNYCGKRDNVLKLQTGEYV